MSNGEARAQRPINTCKLHAETEYEIEIDEPREEVFQITLRNEAARLALATGRRGPNESSAAMLIGALDATLDAIYSDITGAVCLSLAEPGLSDGNSGTPGCITVHIDDSRKRALIADCARTWKIDRGEAMRRLTALALRLIVFENTDDEEPELDQMLADNGSTTVH